MEWYHTALMHPGTRRMEASIRRCFAWPDCQSNISNYLKNCTRCPKFKVTNKEKFGKIPLKEESKGNAFDTLTVDFCGPWQFIITVQEEVEVSKGKTKKGKERKKEIIEKQKRVKIWALTMMDEVMAWIEIMPITNKKSEEIALLEDSEWFNRYPRPVNCIHDNGTEFTGEEFQELLVSYGVKSKPTTVKNLQANTVHEQAHLNKRIC